MKTTPLKEIFDEAFSHVVVDGKLQAKVHKFVGGLMNRDEEHVMFFGSNLTGCYNLRFKTADRNEFLIDILDIDELEIRDRVIKESVFEATWVRANDVYNLSCLYLIHRILKSKLQANDQKKFVDSVCMALNIKLLGSIMAAYFPYKCDDRVAQEVYARLSRKFYIKKLGSWRKVLEKRSEDIIGGTSKWHPVLEHFTDDPEIGQCISDIQGRLRSMIKYVWDVFAQVRADEMKVNRSSSSIEVDGASVIQDLQRNSDKYLRYGQDVVMNRNTLIKPELVTIIDAEMKSMSSKLLVDALNHIADLSLKKSPLVVEFVDACIRHTVEMIQSDRAAQRYMKDLAWIINKEKLLFMAPKTNSSHVFKARELSERFIRESCKTKNPTMIASLKTGLIIYLIARTFAIDHYSN